MLKNQMTTMGTSKEGRQESKSRSDGRTLVRTLSGSFWLWLLALSLCVSVVQSAWLSEVYSAFRQLPPLDQFAVVCAISLFAFGYAATVREFRTDFGERWAARIVGACGVCFLLAFSFRMASTVEKLQNQIAGRTNENATPVAHEISDMVADQQFTVRTSDGHTVSWERATEPVSIADRRIRWSDSGIADDFASYRTTSSGAGRVPKSEPTAAGRE